MLLTITCSTPPATDLGYLLHKHPARLQSFDLAYGQAHVFYPEATDDRCTAALLLEIDPVGMLRGRQRGAGREQLPDQYVNDRPYVASSFLSVALGEVFGGAMSGRSKERQALADQALSLQARVVVVPCTGGEAVLRRLFEPLGYGVALAHQELDPAVPEWGASRYYTVDLTAHCRLRDLLAHLYVLLPVLDDEKHYYVGDDEVEKLLRRGEGWLALHPERDFIARRYLRHRRDLVEDALARLMVDELPPAAASEGDAEDVAPEEAASLHTQRLEAVLAALKAAGAQRVLDLGCGEGRLLRLLLRDPSFTQILGLDVSYRMLERARSRLRLDRLPPHQQQRLTLLHGSLTYRDRRLAGYDAAAVVEVIEHLDPPRLAAFERALFECARPGLIALTTPNAEYNIRFAGLPAGQFRHGDHRFEWSRAQFAEWAHRVAERFGYTARLESVGPADPEVGAPSQLAVFVASEGP